MNIQLARLRNNIFPACYILTFSTFILLTLSASTLVQATEFDHDYKEYDQLLKQVVKPSKNNKQTRVDYQQLTLKQNVLNPILTSFSAVTKEQYDNWSENQKLSFLINVYNGFTLKLIVDNWQKFTNGDAASIRDLGTIFSTPWDKEFFTLFAKPHDLDEVEHKMIRKWFKEPRIHAALVCAAVSCPPLRNEAFIADKLIAQLDSQMFLFLGDGRRNQILFEDQKGKALLSSIFTWYRADFEKGHAGFSSLYDVLNRYSEAMIKGKYQQEKRDLLNRNDFPILFRDYDWRLNDVANF